ncbi:poly(U)-specific endoribonuclease-A [Aplysia californica]|uniref:Uridylate-specific endoribonuclease n=1 Tax=Aplysia californica TaxID=6500 RepID=A0ABM0JQ99_APLCA|nr:poly(U)-specific endoribonuclease-A [Aplysia californica]
MAEGFAADSELSDIISKLWDMDDNKCYPGTDYELYLQGYVNNPREVGRDYARHNLFDWLDEEQVFSRPTYKAFRALLDNYEMDLSEEEEVTWEERQENYDFLTAIMDTAVMKEAHQFLVSKEVAPEDEEEFKKMLHDIWFRLFKRKGGRGNNSCSFEHVFVGEGRGDDMIGLHNWIQFYLQEKAGNIDYHGFFRRETVRDDEILRLMAVQFTWKGIMGKPMCSVFVGSSPEFEIAAYTISLLLDRDGKMDVQLGEYEVELVVHSFGWKKKLGTAYLAAARMDQYAKKKGW